MPLQLLIEIDNIISLLEAIIPANQNSPQNIRLKQKMAKVLEDYFKALSNAFPYSRLTAIYNRNVKESIGSETKGMLDPILATFDKKLQAQMAGEMAEVYLSGQAEMITWGKTKGGVPIAYEGPPISQAVNWAEKQAATLVTQMDKETQRRLAHTISDGIAKKRGIPGLARDIRTDFDDMTQFRSQLIARTETADALSQASLDSMNDMGIDGKQWITAGDDRVSDDCLDNEAEGVIPVGQTFSGGVDAPPQHPDCRCTVAPARLPVKEAMTPADWKAEYKKGVPHWAEDMEPSRFGKDFVKLMKVHNVSSVLEVGCGNGRDTILFAKSGYLATSIDIVPKAVELAKANAKKAKVGVDIRVANVERLPFGDASFGAVFTLSVLHSTNLEKSLPEVARVLQSDGVAFIYLYGNTQFDDGKPTEDKLLFSEYLATLKTLGFKVLESYTENEKEYDEFGEKHRIFVVTLQKES